MMQVTKALQHDVANLAFVPFFSGGKLLPLNEVLLFPHVMVSNPPEYGG